MLWRCIFLQDKWLLNLLLGICAFLLLNAVVQQYMKCHENKFFFKVIFFFFNSKAYPSLQKLCPFFLATKTSPLCLGPNNCMSSWWKSQKTAFIEEKNTLSGLFADRLTFMVALLSKDQVKFSKLNSNLSN